MENINKKNISSLGDTHCETVLPLVPLQPLKDIERSIQKNIVQNFGRHLSEH